MPRIRLPKREITQSGRIGAVPIDPGASRYANEEIARIGEVLGRIGGSFGDLALKSMQINITNQVADAQNQYNSAMADQLIATRQDPDIASWPVKMKEAHERVSRQLTAAEDMLPAAKKRFEQWSAARWNNERVKITLQSLDTIAKKEVNDLPDNMMNFVRSEDRQGFIEHLKSMQDANNLPESMDYWLERYDEAAHFERIRLLTEAGDIQEARRYVNDFVPESDIREKLNAKIDAAEANLSRQSALQRKLAQEQATSQLLANIWDGTLENPQHITDALRLGYLDDTQARMLRKELLNPNIRTQSDPVAVRNVEEALLNLRAGIFERQDVYNTVINNMSGLSPDDGNSYLSEAADASRTYESTWDKEAWDYIEKQFLSFDPITKALTGSAEQQALAAQAIIEYSQARKEAMKKGEPLTGPEHLQLAHKIVLPYREKYKSILPSLDQFRGQFPKELFVPKTRGKYVPMLNEFTRKTLGLPSRLLVAPKNEEDFESTLKSIPDYYDRKWYYNKYAEDVYK